MTELVPATSGSARTIHLVYPHGPSISTPDAIGRNLGARLEGRYRVIHHDWTASYRIEPRPTDVLVGHPHPLPWTVFRRSSRAKGWSRILMLAPFADDPLQIAFEDAVIGDCDQFLAITGPYWFTRIQHSLCSHWRPKMVRLDLAVDRADFPPLKTRFNGPGARRFVYIGHAGHYKNTRYLSEIAGRSPGVEFAWIGGGRPTLPGLVALGGQDFSTATGREVVAGFDFLITVGRADANPTTILEAMAWGLIPVCTPQSGYDGIPGIVNVPLDDPTAATAVVRALQEMPDSELRRIQQGNWNALDRVYTWDRFTAAVVEAMESTESPPLGPVSRARRLQLGWIAATSHHTSPARYLPSLVRARLRAWSRMARGAMARGGE